MVPAAALPPSLPRRNIILYSRAKVWSIAGELSHHHRAYTHINASYELTDVGIYGLVAAGLKNWFDLSMRVVLYFLIWSLRTSLCCVMAKEMIMSNFIVFAKMPTQHITIWGPRRDVCVVYRTLRTCANRRW